MVTPQFWQPACQNQAESSSDTCFRWVHYLAHGLFLKKWKGHEESVSTLDRLQEEWNVGHFVNYTKLVLSWQTKSSLTAYIYAGKSSLFMCLWNIRDNQRLEKTCQEGHPHAGNTGHILHQLKVSRTFRAWRPQTEIVAWLWCTDVDKIVSTLLLKKENSQWSLLEINLWKSDIWQTLTLWLNWIIKKN